MKNFDFSKVVKHKFYHVAIAAVRPLAKLFYRLKVEGRENVPKTGGLVLASNHISVLDPILVALYCPRVLHFMAKAELFQIPLLGRIIKHLNAFPVNRGKGDTTAIEYSVKVVEEGNVLGIFPEGTRSKTGKPGRAKSGAVLIASKTGADVVPCAVVAKEGRVRLFRKTVVRFGKPIPNSDIQVTGTRTSELREASGRIMEEITRLLED